MLLYILLVYAYRTYAIPTTPPHLSFPSDTGTSPSFPSSSETTPFISSPVLTRSASGRNTCSTGERGLVDIVWSCAVTIFACIYKALHPNVPSQELGLWGRLWIKLKLALFMLIAPELIVFWAAKQWIGARKIAKEMNEIDKDIKWTAVHGHFVQMLGLGREDDRRPHIWKWNDINNPEDHGKRLSLKEIYSEGYINLDSLRSIKEDDIMDRSKGDFLSKLFAVLQTSWFILGCIARHRKRLPLTELEVITLASAIINGVLYILWWNKPQNVERRQYLTIRTTPGDKPVPAPDGEVTTFRMRISQWYLSFTKNPLQFIRQLWSVSMHYVYSVYSNLSSGDTDAKPTKGQRFLDFFGSLLGPIFPSVIRTADDVSLSRNAQYFAVDVTIEDLKYVIGLTLVFTAVFGAVHFIAWGFAFSSKTGLVLWRVSCLILLIAPTISPALLVAGIQLNISFLGYAGSLASVLSIPAYIFARFCILVLAFLALRNPDPQVFVDIPWTCYIPHL